MSNFPLLLQRHLLWLAGLPRRRGFGLQSPFAYNLVTRVVHERGEFYAYAELADRRTGATLPEADDRLLLRLANDFQPRLCLLMGGVGEVTRGYVRAGCRACHFSEATAADAHPDMLLVRADGADTAALAAALDGLSPRSLVVLTGIRRSTPAAALWQQVKQHPAVRTTFDLCRLGLAYTDPKLTPAHYTVSYP